MQSDEELAVLTTISHPPTSSAALDEIERRYYERIRSYFRSRGLAADDADELTQEVFLTLVERAVTRKGTFDPARVGPSGRPVRFYSWIFTVAHNLLVDHLRRANKIRPFTDVSETDNALDSFEAELASEGWITELETLEQCAGLRKALEDCERGLPVEERLVIDLWLQSEGEMRLREMAEHLGVKSPTTPKRYLERAFQALQDCLLNKGYNPYTLAVDTRPEQAVVRLSGSTS